MNKIVLAVVLCTVIFASCLDTVTDTVIKEDGSGTMTASVDFSKMIKMLTAGKEKEKEKEGRIDTTIYIRNFSDTSSLLSTEQKRLLRDMSIRVLMDIKEMKFGVTTASSFKSLNDLNALGELMKRKEYDLIFDKALKIPGLSGDNEQESSKENDNLFASVFPDFINCQYSKKSITCTVDTARYAASVKELRGSEFDIFSEEAGAMFSEASFTNTITLPSSVKTFKGESLKKDNADNKLVQSGNLLDLYKHPEKYEYSIQY
jgi:hypothetical protein